MTDFQYIKLTWPSSYIFLRLSMIMPNMRVKSMRNWIHLQVGMIDIFFTSLVKEDEIVDFFVSNFAKNDKVWSKQLLEDEYNNTYLRFRKYKESVNYHFRSDCSLLNDRFISDGISFNDGFISDNGQHPRVLRLLIQGKIDSQTAVILDSVLSYSKTWNKTIKEKVVWPKIAMRLAKLKPFVIYNDTECKLIMKEIFV